MPLLLNQGIGSALACNGQKSCVILGYGAVVDIRSTRVLLALWIFVGWAFSPRLCNLKRGKACLLAFELQDAYLEGKSDHC